MERNVLFNKALNKTFCLQLYGKQSKLTAAALWTNIFD